VTPPPSREGARLLAAELPVTAGARGAGLAATLAWLSVGGKRLGGAASARVSGRDRVSLGRGGGGAGALVGGASLTGLGSGLGGGGSMRFSMIGSRFGIAGKFGSSSSSRRVGRTSLGGGSNFGRGGGGSNLGL